jgi:hypothetical protein
MNDTNPYQPPKAQTAERNEQASTRAPEDVPAGPLLWAAAIVSFLAYAGLNIFLAARTRKADFAELLGTLFGSAIWPFAAVAISSIWSKNRTQRTRVKVFLIMSLALILLALATLLSVWAYARYRQHLLGN